MSAAWNPHNRIEYRNQVLTACDDRLDGSVALIVDAEG
jgi:hypothetical protein